MKHVTSSTPPRTREGHNHSPTCPQHPLNDEAASGCLPPPGKSARRSHGYLFRLVLPLLSGALFLIPLIATGGDSIFPTSRTDLNPKDQKRVASVTRATTDFSKPEQFELMAGGGATTKASVNGNIFSHFSANITFEEEQEFKLGNALFTKLWVSSPSSTQASDGLGPLFNARACQSCHLKDGRGHPPEGAADATSMFLRLARPARTDDERAAIADYRKLNFPDAVYGEQLQDLAVPGLQAEGRLQIAYQDLPVTLADGEVVTLRKPSYSVSDLGFGPMEGDVTLSPRVAPPMIGMGLIQAIHEADLLDNADPDDRDGDGISGKAALVRDHKSGELKIGRFGFKAQNASIRDQSSSAFVGDIGISTPDDPFDHGDCRKAQSDCLALPTGVQPRLGPVEAPDPVLPLVTFYSENLAVPARRDIGDAGVLKGKQLFYQTGCASCHMPKFVTRRDAGNKAHAFQLIWPYSDFLLHDMGEGLADGQQVGVANGQEWRTQPLWGIGLTQTVNGHTFFLHDGRARNLTEAILWHGGEAKTARDAFASLSKTDRASLLTFLESL
ncbi:di-heme oxidoredictase family protein [Neorhizobium sp. DAR64860/K0K1]|uniref:di-heme oxidoreductase family protein n=1 Tax=Neorhizobium sp. DAR64860/K0K1 TaxID=3421955 RepID=UPI003D284979